MPDVRKYLRLCAGTLVLLIGIAGLVLPILPGWLLIFAGIALLANDVPAFRRLLERMERHIPTLRGLLRKCRRWFG